MRTPGGENIRGRDRAIVIVQRGLKLCRRLVKVKLFWVIAAVSLIWLAIVTFVWRRTPLDPSVELEAAPGDATQAPNSVRRVRKPEAHLALETHWQGAELRKAFLEDLRWNYLLEEKEAPYVGSPRWLQQLKDTSPLYTNALAVFPGAEPSREHGVLGVTPEGEVLWQPNVPVPPPFDELSEATKKATLKTRGFYQELSDALPLDRGVPDTREQICQKLHYDLLEFPDASVIITFVNEPLSTLLRTLHSILNETPALLLKEIILVDDHSDFEDDLPGGPLYEYVKYLPKVKLMRLSERRGIVHARMAGIRSAKGEVIIILDSHIEVNKGWIEPQLARLVESPKSVVFPKILGISPTTFQHTASTGIGCHVSWRWSVVEQSTLNGDVNDTRATPSSSMAGGLFAVRRDFFMEIGGYDEGFIAWGAENVEMAFRVWMCGGRVECTPCSRTYHIFRKGSTGYQNPHGALWTNRMRTARVWMDNYFKLAARLIDVSANRPLTNTKLRKTSTTYNGASLGDLTEALRVKQQCGRSFQWFLENVDPRHDIQRLEDVLVLGKIGNKERRKCVDLGGMRSPGDPVSTFDCQGDKYPSGNQGFLVADKDNRIRLMANDKRCLVPQPDGNSLRIAQCLDEAASKWSFSLLGPPDAKMRTVRALYNKTRCLEFTPTALRLTANCADSEWTLLFADAFSSS